MRVVPPDGGALYWEATSLGGVPMFQYLDARRDLRLWERVEYWCFGMRVCFTALRDQEGGAIA